MVKRSGASAKPKFVPRPPQELRSSSSLTDRIPSMSKVELSNLRDNAERLVSNGTPRQIQAATEALPAITAELAAREALHKVALATARSEAKAERLRAVPAAAT